MTDTASATPSAREKFEAWMHDNFGKRSTVRAPDGYAHSVAHAALPSTYASVQMLWEAWQAACRAQPAPVAQGDAEDAARWRWLRENWFTMTSSYDQQRIRFKVGEPRWSDIAETELDAAIDAARKQGGAA